MHVSAFMLQAKNGQQTYQNGKQATHILGTAYIYDIFLTNQFVRFKELDQQLAYVLRFVRQSVPSYDQFISCPIMTKLYLLLYFTDSHCRSYSQFMHCPVVTELYLLLYFTDSQCRSYSRCPVGAQQ